MLALGIEHLERPKEVVPTIEPDTIHPAAAQAGVRFYAKRQTRRYAHDLST